MTESELRDRISKTSDASFAQQCWELLFDVENEYWEKLFACFREARDGVCEMDRKSLDWAQNLVRAAIEDLEKLNKVLAAKKEAL